MEQPASPRSTYHHGNLRAAMIEATLQLIDEKGPDNITVSDAAKRAGVSSGAPFRHFASKIELMTAVAEVLQNELLERMEIAYGIGTDPWETLFSLGLAYMTWGLENPARFRTYSNRNLYDFNSSDILREGSERMNWLVESTFLSVLPENPIQKERARRLNIHARALITGLVNLYCYGLFPHIGVVGEEPLVTLRKSWQGFLRTVRFTLDDRPTETGFYTLFGE